MGLQEQSFADPPLDHVQPAKSRFPFGRRDKQHLCGKRLLKLRRHGKKHIVVPDNHRIFGKTVRRIHTGRMRLDPAF